MTEKPLALGILGHPIGHTLSPSMHNVAANIHKISISYSAYDVKPENLKDAIDGIRALSIDGVNVTVPHKTAVIPYLDEISPEARQIGAVNTITRNGEKLVGSNTDMYGFITAIKENGGVDPGGKRIFVYGAGGAARAVVYGLAMEKAMEITIANRTESKAVSLAVEVIQSEPETNLKAIGFGSNKLFDSLSMADIIVNATSLGMGGADEFPPGAIKFNKNQLVVDIVYRPLITPLLARAREDGAKTLDGLWMLIHQGASSFRLWTGKSFPVDKAREVLLTKL